MCYVFPEPETKIVFYFDIKKMTIFYKLFSSNLTTIFAEKWRVIMLFFFLHLLGQDIFCIAFGYRIKTKHSSQPLIVKLWFSNYIHVDMLSAIFTAKLIEGNYPLDKDRWCNG